MRSFATLRTTRLRSRALLSRRAASHGLDAALAPLVARIVHLLDHRIRHPGVAAGHVGPVGLCGIAVDQRPRIERVRHAADLMLDLEQGLAAVEVGDHLEAILILIALLGHETAIEQLPVRRGEIADIDLDVVPVIGRYLRLGLAEDQLLSLADRDPRRRRTARLVDARDRTEDLG